MVKFSIIIPVYNISSDYILKCINSIEEQKFKFYEIIIVNDGSDYETSTLLLTIEEKYQNIVVIEQKNAGVSAARNTGLKSANGEWILFVDPDDWIEEDSLSILDEKINNSKDMVIFSYYDVIGEERHKKTINEINYISKIDLQLGLLDYRCRKLQCFFGVVWNCAYKTEMLKLYYLNAQNDNMGKMKKEWKTILSSPVFVILKKQKMKAFILLNKCKVYQLYLLAIYLRSFSLTKFAYKFGN